MNDIQNTSAFSAGIYTHPDGTVFRRNKFGFWAGSDGSEVTDTYIEFRVFTDAVDATEYRMGA